MLNIRCVTMKRNLKAVWAVFKDNSHAQDAMIKAVKKANDIAFIAKKDTIGGLTSDRGVISTISFPRIGNVVISGDVLKQNLGYSESGESFAEFLMHKELFEKEARALEQCLNDGDIILYMTVEEQKEDEIRAILEKYKPAYLSS